MKINTKYIKKVMEKRGWGVSDLAHQAKKKESWIYGVLSGARGRSFATVEVLAKALDVDPVDLVES